MRRVTRREFVALGAAGAAAAPFVLDPARLGAASVTAQQIVDRITKAVGVEWKTGTVDSFKAGDPSAAVTGVVTTSLATIEVLRQAVKAGANMVITAGPTFYSRADSRTPPAGRGRGAATGPPPADRVFTAKNDLIAANGLVVWRFSDHWRLRTPNPFAQGLTAALGWDQYRDATDPGRVTLPPTSLERLASAVMSQLEARGGVRVVGNPAARVRTVGVLPGTVPIQGMLALLPQVDVVVAGEIREWESSEYARDVVTSGRDKGLILVGRTLSEEGGMQVCADWLKTLVPEAPVRWVRAGDPYWRPTA
jgi:putative NIF3 family GTP cyclohydrolase 1 type 2